MYHKDHWNTKWFHSQREIVIQRLDKSAGGKRRWKERKERWKRSFSQTKVSQRHFLLLVQAVKVDLYLFTINLFLFCLNSTKSSRLAVQLPQLVEPFLQPLALPLHQVDVKLHPLHQLLGRLVLLSSPLQLAPVLGDLLEEPGVDLPVLGHLRVEALEGRSHPGLTFWQHAKFKPGEEEIRVDLRISRWEPESHNFLLSLFKSLVQSFHPDEGVEEEVEVLRRRPEFETFVDVAIVAACLLLPLLKGGGHHQIQCKQI